MIFPPLTFISESLPLWDQFCHDCQFVSSLAHGRDLQEALSPKVNLFPPDITRILAKRAADEEQRYVSYEQIATSRIIALLKDTHNDTSVQCHAGSYKFLPEPIKD